MYFIYVFFFFQAEDGIRDVAVTGVQTCALPFSSRRRHTRCSRDWSSDVCSSDLEPEVDRVEDPELPLVGQVRSRGDRRVVRARVQVDDHALQAPPLPGLEPHELDADRVVSRRLDDGLLHLDRRLAGDEVERDAHAGAHAESRRGLRREPVERELRRLARRAHVAAPEDDGRADGDALQLAMVRRPPHVALGPRERAEAAAADLAAERVDIHGRQHPLQGADAVAAPSAPTTAVVTPGVTHRPQGTMARAGRVSDAGRRRGAPRLRPSIDRGGSAAPATTSRGAPLPSAERRSRARSTAWYVVR